MRLTTDQLFSDGPCVMGVVNVTPDSFSDGGSFIQAEKAIAHGADLIEKGADILDVGGESTRPGAKPVEASVEIDRIIPVIEGLAGQAKWISVDTRHAETMKAALKAGANIINDISGLEGDIHSLEVAAQSDALVILMHMQGTPESMQDKPHYNNVLEDVFQYLKSRIQACETRRIDAKSLIIDPGIGFGKSLEDNLLILRNIKKFSVLGVPVMVGTSRKSFIEKIDQGAGPQDRLGGSLASVIWAAQNGVKIFRVHDVAETVQALKVYQAISSG